MKPVSISQYLDHIGRAAQAEGQPSRQGTLPFKPRAIRAVQDLEPRSRPLLFKRVLREAATAAHSPALEEGQERAVANGRSQPAETPDPEIEARIAEAFERGREEGLAAARAENAETLAREQASQQERAAMERLEFQLNEYAKLADTIAAGLLEIEQRIAATVARSLAPFLTQELSKQVVDELCNHIARLRTSGSPGLIKIRGPERLLSALRDRVSLLSVDVEFVVEDGVEATIEARHTMIKSELQPWADLVASLVD